MNEVQIQNVDSTQQIKTQTRIQQLYKERNKYSAETEKLYLKMKEGWL